MEYQGGQKNQKAEQWLKEGNKEGNDTVHLAAQRRLDGEHAELLDERVGESKASRRMRGIARVLIVIAAVALTGYAVMYYIAVPRIVHALPTMVPSPRVAYGDYKRVTNISVDYYPPVSSRHGSGLAEVDQGGSFLIVTSADILKSSDVEGSARLYIDKSKQFNGLADIDLNYKVVKQDGHTVPDAYVVFSRLPDDLSDINASPDNPRWFKYTSKGTKADAGTDEFLSLMSGAALEPSRPLIDLLWEHALKSNAIEWHLDHGIHKDNQNSWAVDLAFTLRPEAIPSVMESLRADQRYKDSYQKTVESSAWFSNAEDFFSALRSLSGTVTIGVGDHLVHNLQIDFDSLSKSIGVLRGTLATSVTPMHRDDAVDVPQDTGDLHDVLSLFFLSAASAQTGIDAASTVDSDNDGLTDQEETSFGSDPKRTDSDGDGYPDGDEVNAGYNPAGPGLLKR